MRPRKYANISSPWFGGGPGSDFWNLGPGAHFLFAGLSSIGVRLWHLLHNVSVTTHHYFNCAVGLSTCLQTSLIVPPTVDSRVAYTMSPFALNNDAPSTFCPAEI